MRHTLSLSLTVLFFGFLIAPANAAELIGKVTKIQGDATETIAGKKVSLESGSGIHEDCVIETGPGTRLRVVFLDGSQLTLGEDARLVVDEMVYSAPSAASGQISQSFEIFAGTMRFISGAVSRQKAEAVRISTPVATIGIRGTDFFAGPLSAGAEEGSQRYGFMSIEGAIEVTGAQGSVVLDEPEEGTFLPTDGQAAPTEPSQWRQPAIDEAFASIAFE